LPPEPAQGKAEGVFVEVKAFAHCHHRSVPNAYLLAHVFLEELDGGEV